LYNKRKILFEKETRKRWRKKETKDYKRRNKEKRK